MAGEDECPQCAPVQVYSWGVFMGLLLMSWETVLPALTARLLDEMNTCLKRKRRVRRTFLIVLALYAIVVVWMRIVLLSVGMYVGATIVSMSAEFAIAEVIRTALRSIANPAYLFNALTVPHVPFHASLLIAMFMAAFVAVCGYIMSDDLTPNDRSNAALQAKFMRILFAMPAVMVAIYAVYAAYNVMLTLM
jgi:signal transduction histidine kinase